MLAWRLVGRLTALWLLGAASVSSQGVWAQEPARKPAAETVEAGRAIAEARCASCHAVGPSGASPLPPAPPLRELHRRYPVEHLAEALAEGIAVGHPAMPEVVLEPPEIDAFIAYLQSLEPSD